MKQAHVKKHIAFRIVATHTHDNRNVSCVHTQILRKDVMNRTTHGRFGFVNDFLTSLVSINFPTI